MVKITNKTTVGEALPFLKGEHLEELLKICDPIPLKKPVISMTLGEFLECLDDNYYQTFFEDYQELLVVAIGRVNQFKKEMEDISKVMKLNEVTESAEEKAAKNGIVWPSFQENMLCNALDWFHLHSLDDAENIPLSNYLVYARKVAAEAKFERQLNQIYMNKNKLKKK